mgnify:CR=1 FL=1
MIARIIDASIANRLFIVLAAVAVTLAGFWAVRTTPVDALPDLSDVQVVVRSNYPGQAPRIVEDQVTYPLATTMLSVPGAKTVRGYSMFGDSYVYIIFEDGTDLYWARSRVLEYLNQVQNRLPDGVQSTLGPDATGVGWIYEYALVDRSGGHDLAGLRSLQDWFLRYELKTIPGIAEVASVGGMVKQYQIVLDPYRMASLGVTHAQVVRAVQAGNQETGGSIVEMGEAEYMVRASGYLGTLADFRSIPLRAQAGGTPVTLDDVANIQIGPELRRGIAELNGEGEVAGGIVILRQGADARSAIAAVEAKLEQLQASLPEGVEIVTTYDRSQLIDASVENLTTKLIEEFMVLANVAAAETLIAKRTPLLFRVHEEPPADKLESLRETAEASGLTLAKGQVLKTAHLNKLLHDAAGTEESELINLATLRSMTQAYYSPKNFGHFGLALQNYAHFTSPIRRYSDLIVHRGLIAAHGWGDDGLSPDDIDKLEPTAAHISDTERRSMIAERDTTDRYLAAYLSERVGNEFTGRISGIARFGAFVKLDETGADGLIPMRNLGREYFHFDQETATLMGSDTGLTITIGQRVTVRLTEAAPVTGGIALELLEIAKSHVGIVVEPLTDRFVETANSFDLSGQDQRHFLSTRVVGSKWCVLVPFRLDCLAEAFAEHASQMAE